MLELLRACDVCVTLRVPTMGETSAVAVRALALGRPLVVTDVGWFSELPEEATLKIPVFAVVGEIAQAAHEVGLDASSPELDSVAEALHEVRGGG